MSDIPSFTRTGKPEVEVLEAYLPLGATPAQKRMSRQTMGQMIAKKIEELNPYEMVSMPDGTWALRCRLIIHFSGVAAKPTKEDF